MASTVPSLPAATYKPGPNDPVAKQIITGAAKQYGIDPAILYGLYGTESGYGTNTGPSSAGAVGPFQFMPKTASGMGVNPYNFQSAASGAAWSTTCVAARTCPARPANTPTHANMQLATKITCSSGTILVLIILTGRL